MFITIYFCIIVFIIILVLFIEIQVRLESYKKSGSQIIMIKITVFKGLNIYENDISAIFRQKKRLNEYQFSIVYKKIAAIIKSIKIIDKSIRKMLDRILIKELKIHLTAGAGEAFMTGIINGVLWMLTAIIDTFISNNVRVLLKSIIIKSDFKEKIFKMDIGCIIVLRIAYIMDVAVKILILYYKEKLIMNNKKRRCVNCLNIL